MATLAVCVLETIEHYKRDVRDEVEKLRCPLEDVGLNIAELVAKHYHVLVGVGFYPLCFRAV